MVRVRPLDLVIAGTPRSGTTLVQRLVSELEGVSVPPETHVLSLRGRRLLRRRAFPLAGDALVAELESYSRLPTSQELRFDPDDVVRRLDGCCESLWDLYATIARSLAGDTDLVGEKTPDHLLWWRPLSVVWPECRFVLVVRDPRAVVASNLDVPFGMGSTALLARRWMADDREVEDAATELAHRCMVVRYEDVVDDPDRSVEELRKFLRRAPGPGSEDPAMLHLPWESWKRRASGPVTSERTTAWRGRLSERQIATVEAVCGVPMMARGYQPIAEVHAAPPSPADRLRAAHFTASRFVRRWEIERSVSRG